ncbi:hypothetical protein V6Z96_007337 [Aspergillus fumigatus]
MSLRRSSLYLLFMVVALLSCTSFTLASTPASFCKCTCFTNSTIIPLDSPNPESTPPLNSFDLRDDNATFHEKRVNKYRALSCNDCNRKFCLDYNLPMCKGAKEDDVFTTCFQRDSRKDEAIVFIFIIATSGLLTWAACKPWVEKWLEAARERRSYIPVSENAER